MTTPHFLSPAAIEAVPADQISDIVSTLIFLAEKYPGKVLFATTFTPEDQIIAHLIFKNNINIRVYVPGADAHYPILIKSVDFFQAGIEVLYKQSEQTARHQAKSYPELPDTAPQNWPLTLVLRHPHLLVSGQRKAQLPTNIPKIPWTGTAQQSVYHPLLDWDNEQVAAYLHHFQIPQRTTLPVAEKNITHSAWRNPVILQ